MRKLSFCDGYTHYLEFGEDFTVIYNGQKMPNYIFNVCSLLNVKYMSIKLLETQKISLQTYYNC